jgi:RNA polymerase sigma-70 factor, ECF subfamily
MLRVVEGGETPEIQDKRDGHGEAAVLPHQDQVAMRDLLRSAITPKVDPFSDLAMLAAQGDELALGQLLRSVAAPLLSAVRAIVGRKAPDVEDIVQETMVAFVRALPAFRGDCSVVYYATRIAVRTAITANKRRAMRESCLGAFIDPVEQRHVSSPGDAALASRRRDALRSLLEQLPEVQAETFAFRVVLGYSMQEVAEATDAPLNTVRSRLRLAKEALRRRIEEDPILIEILGGQA